VTYFSASAVNSGKPTTTPIATIANEVRSLRAGRFSRNSSSSANPSRPAIAARATVRKTGSKSITATRVAGSDALKIRTPRNPLSHPLVVLSIWLSAEAHLYRANAGGAPRDSAVWSG
jgi:hypothetical protein